MKEFADDNFKFDENGRKSSKRVENTVGKGEIAHYEQFLHFPQCFQKASFPEASKGVIMWEWVKRPFFIFGLKFGLANGLVFIKFKVVVCKLFEFGRFQHLLFGQDCLSNQASAA